MRAQPFLFCCVGGKGPRVMDWRKLRTRHARDDACGIDEDTGTDVKKPMRLDKSALKILCQLGHFCEQAPPPPPKKCT
jgi:hypothetical protein